MDTRWSFRRWVGRITYAFAGEITGFARLIITSILVILLGSGVAIWLLWDWLVAAASTNIGAVLVLVVGVAIIVTSWIILVLTSVRLAEAVMD